MSYQYPVGTVYSEVGMAALVPGEEEVCVEKEVAVDGTKKTTGIQGLLKPQWPVIRSLNLVQLSLAVSPVTSAILNSTALGSTETSPLSRSSALGIDRSRRS